MVLALALIAAVAHGAAHGATVNVLATSAGTRFAETVAPMPISEYSGLLSTILGLSSPTPYSWNGLLPAGLFNRPRTVASIVIEGPTISLEDAAIKSFPLNFDASHSNIADALRTLAGGRNIAAVPELVSTVFGSRATVVSVSADPNAAVASGLGFGEASSHTVSLENGVFVDSAINSAPLPFAAAIDWSRFNGVVYDEATKSATFNGVVFAGEDFAVFSELHAMFEVASALKNHADSHPSVVTFTITTLASIVERNGATTAVAVAAGEIVTSMVVKIAKQLEIAYGEKAVVFAVSLGAGIDRTVRPVVSQVRSRRQAASVTDSTLNQSIPLAQYAAYPQLFTVNQCARYQCFCFSPYTAFQSTAAYLSSCGNTCYNFSAYNNASFAALSTSSEAAGCVSLGEDVKGQLCAWSRASCDCSNAEFFTPINGKNGINYMYAGLKLPGVYNISSGALFANVGLRAAAQRAPGRAMSTDPQCIRCAFGFTLSNGICYRDNSETASMQAALWVWLAGTAGLIGMWYVLHQINYGGKWAYLGDVPDFPDAKKTR